ncbi:MAG: anti-sigma factor [Polyangiaceae bacterium]
MTRPETQLDPRAEELLADRALYGLEAAETAELRALGVEDDTSFDEAAAAIDLATLKLEPMPERIAKTLRAAAPGASKASLVTPGELAPPPGHAKPARSRQSLGWLAAAACLVLAASSWLYVLRQPAIVRTVSIVGPTPSTSETAAPPKQPTPEEARAALLAEKDVEKADWTATKDPTAVGAKGDVVWSPSEQRGYMRFQGLAVNDKTKGQYQLWIFDKNRDAKYPVDGGVFDIATLPGREGGDVIVPIAARLHVDDATLFAVTYEKPGGVVVSKRERMVVTAAITRGG